MRHQLSIALDVTITPEQTTAHCDISAELDGDGPDVIRLEEVANAHQRDMAKDAHLFLTMAAPIIIDLLGKLNGQPASGDTDNGKGFEEA